MNPLCANCYKRDAQKWCGRCGCRYCSAECQRDHWRASHKEWCGKTGQWGRDYEIKPSPDKQGLGVFALRDFKKYDVIIAERNVTTGPGGDFPSESDDRLQSGLEAAYQRGVESGTSEELLLMWKYSIFPVKGRVNNDCLGNARSMDIRTGHPGVFTKPGEFGLLKAVRDISAGEEICEPYGNPLGELSLTLSFVKDSRSRQESAANLGFQCKCAACTNPEVDAKLCELFWMLKEESTDVNITKEKAKKMLALADELGCAPPVYFRIYVKLLSALSATDQIFNDHEDEIKEIVLNINEIGTKWYGPDSTEAKFGKMMIEEKEHKEEELTGI